MYLAGIILSDGTIDGTLRERSDRVIVPDGRTFSYLLYDGGVRICITQNDVRQIQLAKAALYAGVKLLMDHMQVDRSGSHRSGRGIRQPHRSEICDGPGPHTRLSSEKMWRRWATPRATAPRIALLDRAARQDIEQVVRRVQKVETAVEPHFQAHFVEAMSIPHRSDPFPETVLRGHPAAAGLPRTTSRATSVAPSPRPPQRNPPDLQERRTAAIHNLNSPVARWPPAGALLWAVPPNTSR